MAGQPELLLRIERTSLFCSQGDAEPEQASAGAFTITILEAPGATPTLRAQAGDVYWGLGQHVACYRNSDRAYSFSVPESEGLYLTLVLDPGTGQGEVEALQTILHASTTYDATPRAGPAAPTAYDAVSRHVVQGGAMLGAGLLAVGKLAGAGLQKGAEYATAKLAPAQQPMQVSAATMKNLERVRGAAAATAGFTGRVASGAVNAAGSVVAGLGHALKPLTTSLSSRASASGVDMAGVKKVGAASATAFVEVFRALEETGDLVLRSLSSATTQVVHHRYGEDAAAATQVGMGAAISAVEARRNLMILRPSHLAKKAVKHTVKGHVHGIAAGHGGAVETGVAAAGGGSVVAGVAPLGYGGPTAAGPSATAVLTERGKVLQATALPSGASVAAAGAHTVPAPAGHWGGHSGVPVHGAVTHEQQQYGVHPHACLPTTYTPSASGYAPPQPHAPTYSQAVTYAQPSAPPPVHQRPAVGVPVEEPGKAGYYPAVPKY